MNNIKVFYEGAGLLLCKQVADDLNLSQGYQVKSLEEFREILKLNALMGIADCVTKEAIIKFTEVKDGK